MVSTETPTIFIVFTVIVALHIALNLLNVNLLAQLNTISAWWHTIGVAVVVAVLAVVPEHQPVSFVFSGTINNSGFSGTGIGFWFVFGIGLLMAKYTITGYDSSCRWSPRWCSVWVLLVAITFAVPDVQGTVDAAANAVAYIWTTSLGNAWAIFLLTIAAVAQFFCGTASVTSASRMLFAFSRDRAVPGSRVWRKVARNRVPVNAVIAIAVLAWILMLPTLVNGAVGYLVGTSIAVIGLYIAMAMPIFLRIRAGERFEHGAWSLGRHYKWISTVAVVWILFICVLFLMPVSPNGIPGAAEFDWDVVNYAPLTVGGALILFGGWYALSARHWFTGPIREAGSDADLAEIERELRAP